MGFIFADKIKASYGVDNLATLVVQFFLDKGKKLGGAESCTGGMVAAQLTAISGASGCFEGAVVSYSNEVKHCVLGVSCSVLEQFGAVSEETVGEMLRGTLGKMGTDYAYAISGIAGPGGGTTEKPVGTVVIGVSTSEECFIKRFYFTGNRDGIREKSVEMALLLLFLQITSTPILDIELNWE